MGRRVPETGILVLAASSILIYLSLRFLLHSAPSWAGRREIMQNV